MARTNEEEGGGGEPEHRDDMVVFFLEPELHPPRVRHLFPRARTRAEPTGYMVWQPRLYISDQEGIYTRAGCTRCSPPAPLHGHDLHARPLRANDAVNSRMHGQLQQIAMTISATR